MENIKTTAVELMRQKGFGYKQLQTRYDKLVLLLKKNAKLLDVDTLTCMVCKNNHAVWRISIPWESTEITPCLCDDCVGKPDEEILKEVLKNG